MALEEGGLGGGCPICAISFCGDENGGKGESIVQHLEFFPSFGDNVDRIRVVHCLAPDGTTKPNSNLGLPVKKVK